MKKFVIRNYGNSRTLPVKGKGYFLCKEGTIETDDEELADALGTFPQIHVSSRSPRRKKGQPLPSSSGDQVEQQSEATATAVIESDAELGSDKIDTPEDADDQPNQPGEAMAYEEDTVEQLRDMAKQRDIPIGRKNKAEIIEVLREADAQGL